MRNRHLVLGTTVCLLSGYLASCGSSPIDTTDQEHETIATKSGLYCAYVRQTGKVEELQLELNSEVAKHCGHGRVPSLTQYIIGEVRGIMYCCNKENEPKQAPAPAAAPVPSPSPSLTPAPRPSLLPRFPVKKPSPLPIPQKLRRALPPAQRPMLIQPAQQPQAQPQAQPQTQPLTQPQSQPPAQTPNQAPTPRRPDQDPAVLPTAAP